MKPATPETATPARGIKLGNIEPIAVKQFGKYFLVRKIAEGGMAEIFLAKQVGAEGFERNVVIKRMLAHLSAVSDFVGMFLDEARLAARLAHPNIIQINDLGLADGCYYICMEYLAGEDFSTMLRTAGRRREYVPLHVVLRVIADAAHGLHFAHEFADEKGKPLNIVHRDISPSNIYVTYQGQVKVLDFGIARAESRVTNTTAGVVKGKYMYMSREQASGAVVDRRSDVFSLGVSLYEALTNVRPFARDNDLAILNAVLKNDYQPLLELRPDLPIELDAILKKSMTAKAEDRYQTAAAFAADIEHYLASSTSAGGGAMVASYMRQFFGDERYQNKTRIPTLASLAQNGVDVPGFTNPSLPKTEPEVGVAGAQKTVAGVAPALATEAPTRAMSGSSMPSEVAKASSRGRGRVVAIALVLAAAAAGGGFAAMRTLSSGPATPPAPKSDPVVAGVEVKPPPPEVKPPPPDVKPDPVVAVAKAQPVKLGAKEIQGVVGRKAAAFQRCFQEHKDDLPGAKGLLAVTFTIVSSGKVAQATSEQRFAGTPVAKCVEGQVRALKFPAHVDKEVTLTLPLEYNQL